MNGIEGRLIRPTKSTGSLGKPPHVRIVHGIQRPNNGDIQARTPAFARTRRSRQKVGGPGYLNSEATSTTSSAGDQGHKRGAGVSICSRRLTDLIGGVKVNDCVHQSGRSAGCCLRNCKRKRPVAAPAEVSRRRPPQSRPGAPTDTDHTARVRRP